MLKTVKVLEFEVKLLQDLCLSGCDDIVGAADDFYHFEIEEMTLEVCPDSGATGEPVTL